MRHLISPSDLSLSDINKLIAIATDIENNPENYTKVCENKTMATLFFEPSTRTRLSHESAMLNLGGNILGFSSADASSAAKGESISDTIRTVSCYADLAVIRHPKEGSSLLASQYSTIPIINGGDGPHHHPTQTLTDLLTIAREKGRLDNFTIGLCGDLKHGRTVHSLIEALLIYDNIEFVLISPDELQLPTYIKDKIIENSTNTFSEFKTIEESISQLDILYMTRVQKERFSDIEKYEEVKDSCILMQEHLSLAKNDMIIMHPLPRVNEIDPRIDSDSRAVYFKQVQYGILIRMALIIELLDASNFPVDSAPTHEQTITTQDFNCQNSNCITNSENNILFIPTKKMIQCPYCDSRI